MAKIKVVLEHPLYNGMVVTIGAPCECSAVTGLTVSYDGVSKSFIFRDAHGNDLTGLGNLFSEGAYIRAVLDTENGYAYIQNADTNGYIEQSMAEKFSKKEDFVFTEGIHFGEELPSPGINGRAFIKIVTPTSDQAAILSNPTFFEGGVSGASGVVGVSDGVNRVVRYEFTTSDAAAGIAFEKASLSLGSGTVPDLKFQITADDSSYGNAGKNHDGAELTRTYHEHDDWYTFSGELAVEMLPNTKYYLWVFPATTTFGWLYWNYKDDVTATVKGRKKHGEFYLDTGTEWVICSYGSVTISGGGSGTAGENGATFIPYVDADGNLSWTNDGGLTNPATVNIKGPAGEDGSDGQPGKDGAAGKDGNGIKSAVLNADYTLTLTFDDGTSYTTPSIRGATGAAGSDGKDGSPGATGQDGADGKDGVSATHSWNGTTLTITSAAGTSSADLKGDKGDKGDTGATGADGQDGFTPQKGIDYFTSEDKEVMVKEVLAALPIYDGEVVAV